MKAFVFPGQAAQFPGMGKDMFENSETAKKLFQEANEILGFDISEIMFHGSAEDLQKTKVTQPAVFLHSYIKSRVENENFNPDVVAGHSLGEFSALAAVGAMSFQDGLQLVSKRAQAMQIACDAQKSTMAAILGLENEVVEKVCAEIEDVVVPANYNCPGQLVISGSLSGIDLAVAKLTEAGARRAIVLPVNGAFHSPLMASAKEELALAIESTEFNKPSVPIYQNVDAVKRDNPEEIKENLIAQLTGPVKWQQIMEGMLKDGVTEFVEVGGNGKVLSGFVRKVDRSIPTQAL